MKLTDILPTKIPPAAGKKRGKNIHGGAWMETFMNFLVSQCGWVVIDKKNMSKKLLRNAIDLEDYYGQDYLTDCGEFSFALLSHPVLPNVIGLINWSSLILVPNEKATEFVNYLDDDADEVICELSINQLQKLELDSQNGLLVSSGILAVRIA